MERIYVTKNIEELAELLVRTWKKGAPARAKRLAGRNPRGVKLLLFVDSVLNKEKPCAS